MGFVEAAVFEVRTGPSSLGIDNLNLGDFDGDGVLDAVLNINGELQILPGDGAGSFAPFSAVEFTPGGEGAVVAELVLLSNDVERPRLSVTLAGSGRIN